MPFEMGGYLQYAVAQGKVYIGGGGSGFIKNEKSDVVMVYDLNSQRWDKLPPYKIHSFAMTAIDDQLVLVGGKQFDGGNSRALGVWGAEEWIHPYPDMPAARRYHSVVTYKEWLVVVGGKSGTYNYMSSINIMNTTSKQWHTVSSTPAQISHMWTAVVGDVCYHGRA